MVDVKMEQEEFPFDSPKRDVLPSGFSPLNSGYATLKELHLQFL